MVMLFILFLLGIVFLLLATLGLAARFEKGNSLLS